jgi:hypothetical protein
MIKRTLFVVLSVVLLSLMVVGLGRQTLPTIHAQDGEATSIPVSEEEETACTQLTTLALETVDQLCQAIGRNQACYGNLMVNAEPRVSTETLTFDKAGDIASLTSIRSLTLSGLDVVKQEWGVALMRLQANLPDTLPGQNVTFLLFGDVKLEDTSSATEFHAMTARTGLNVRFTPSDSAPILGSFAAGAQIEAAGRYGEWVQVKYAAHPGLTGWVNSNLLDGDVEALPEVDVRSQVKTPMQSVYFKSGVGEPQCEDAPRDGLLVQSPKGLGLVNFSINGVELQMGSTAYISFEQDELSYTLIEGKAFVSSNNVIQRVYPGQETRIQLDDSGEAVGGPSYPKPYNSAPLDFLRPMLEMLPDPIPYLPAPLEPQSPLESAQEIADFIASTTASVPDNHQVAITPTSRMILGEETLTQTPTPTTSASDTSTALPTKTDIPAETEIGAPTATDTAVSPTETATDVPPTETPVSPTPTEIIPTDVLPTFTPLPPTDIPTDVPPTEVPPTPIPATSIPDTEVPPTPVPPTEPPALCAFNEDIQVLAIFISEPSAPKGVKYDLYLLDKFCNEIYVGRVKRAKPAIFLTHVSRVWIVRDARSGVELLRWTPTIGGEFTVWLSGGTPATEEPDSDGDS